MLEAIRSFDSLKKACAIKENEQGLSVFNAIKAKVLNKNAETFWKLLEHRMSQACFFSRMWPPFPYG